jgi:hypothetical protein
MLLSTAPRGRRDFDAACPLKFGQQLLVRATKSTGYQNDHRADRHIRKPNYSMTD